MQFLQMQNIWELPKKMAEYQKYLKQLLMGKSIT